MGSGAARPHGEDAVEEEHPLLGPGDEAPVVGDAEAQHEGVVGHAGAEQPRHGHLAREAGARIAALDTAAAALRTRRAKKLGALTLAEVASALLDDVLVVIGGIIPDVDIPGLKAAGIKAE